ncbi:MAG: YcaO-like family protein, partial [Halomonas sp.]|uniref:YcaO-like family protein n=1 Tax=Halomonas sp. TaxID=1486246 RepID=UPI003970F679
ALERSLTELLQGRSFEGLNDFLPPTFNSQAVAEPNNFVEHFIDSSGLVSWRFFSSRADVDFCEWDFSASGARSGSRSTQEEAATLFGILEEMGLETYQAVHEDLGAPVCRILVPGYSEVYPVEDLVWDNTNMALDYREDILNLHRLSDDALADLAGRLEESQLDDQMDIITLIGIEFDENTAWGQLTILELKLLINLALGQHEEALERVEMFLQFNDNTVERNLFYRAVQAVLEIVLDDELELDDFRYHLGRMFGEATLEAVIGSVQGTVRFHGLTPTSMGLEGLDRHQRLIDSYRKLHAARAARAGMRAPGA